MKKGFTLIELLAVIVILAIIALIAVPIVLNIINDSKESSLLRSAEFYLDAVEYTIADAFLYHGGLEDKEYPIDINGDICKIELDNEGNCPLTGDKSNTLKVEVNGDKPTGGSITINGGNIFSVELKIDEKIIVKNTDGELVYKNIICKAVTTATTGTIPATTSGFVPGDEYMCEVKPGTSYRFFVLSLEGDKVNLILEANISETGEPVNKSGLTVASIKYASNDDYWGDEEIPESMLNDNNMCQLGGYCSFTDKGPITVMKVLKDITANWTNVNNYNELYSDKFGSYSNFVINSKVRLPKYDEIYYVGCRPLEGEDSSVYIASCPLWLINYLSNLHSNYVGSTQLSNGGSEIMLMDGGDHINGYTNAGYKKIYGGDGLISGGNCANESANIRPVIQVDRINIED